MGDDMSKLTHRVYVVERLVHGKWTPKELLVTTIRWALRGIAKCDANTSRVRRVNSEEDMCRIIDLDVKLNLTTERITNDPSQLEWTI